MVLGIGHDDHDAFVVVVPLAGEPPAEGRDNGDGLVDVLDRDVEMDTGFATLRLRDRLEDQARVGIATIAEIHPAVLRRAGLTTEQCGPEPRHTLGIEAVEGHAGPDVGHLATLRPRGYEAP
jgi:hypothetical protein